MKGLLIPGILGAIILITGFLAFLPIEQASTVHTQIIGVGGLDLDDLSNTRQSIQVVSDNDTAITDGDTVVIDCDVDFYVMDTYWGIDDLDAAAGEQLAIGDGATFITVDGTALVGEDDDSSTTFVILGEAGNGNNLDVQTSWVTAVIDEIQSAGVPGDISHPVYLFAEGAGNNDIVITISDNDGGKQFDVVDTLTVTALIQTQSNANCSVSVNTQ